MTETPRVDTLTFLRDPSCQRGRVFLVMEDAATWLQLHEIAAEIRRRFGVIDSEAAISARLRDLRNLYHQTVLRKRREGSHADEYRLVTTTQWYLCGCGHEFPASLGKYGCPNCHGEEGAELQGLLPFPGEAPQAELFGGES